MDRWMGGQIDGWTYRYKDDRWMGGWVGGYRQMDGQVDRWMDIYLYKDR